MLLPVWLSLFPHWQKLLILLSSVRYHLCPSCTMMGCDALHRTPQQLLSTVEVILAAYERSAGSASMLGQAGTLMNPEVIVRMRDIQEAIKKDL